MRMHEGQSIHDSDVKLVPGWDNLMKGAQCYEHFGGIVFKNHAFFYNACLFNALY